MNQQTHLYKTLEIQRLLSNGYAPSEILDPRVVHEKFNSNEVFNCIVQLNSKPILA